MGTFKEFMEISTPAGAHVYKKFYQSMFLSPPSPDTTPPETYPQAMANWEMGVLDKVLDLVHTADAQHFRGKKDIIVSQDGAGNLRHYATTEFLKDWHPQAIKRMQELRVLSTQSVNGITDHRDNRQYNGCYELNPVAAHQTLVSLLNKYRFIQASKNVGMRFLQQAGQGMLQRDPGTDIFGS